MDPNRTRKWGVWLSAALLSLWLAGCVTPIPGASHELFDFLRIGHTTREEVILKLGQPSGSYEQERILTYRIGEDATQGHYVISPRAMMAWQQVHYSLVLVFDERGQLQKKNLVPVY